MQQHPKGMIPTSGADEESASANDTHPNIFIHVPGRSVPTLPPRRYANLTRRSKPPSPTPAAPYGKIAEPEARASGSRSFIAEGR